MRHQLLRSCSGAALCTAMLLGPAVPLQPPVVVADATVGDEVTCERGNPTYLPDQPRAFSLLGIARAQQISLGDGVTVAVVDSGVDNRNLHLTNVLPGYSVLGGAATTDDEGHGTAVAGIIAAQPVPGSGIVGVAPKARILPVKVYESTQDGNTGHTPIGPNLPMTAQGIVWAADQGAKIIVVALSTSTDSPDLLAAVQHAQQRGALIVASAGNRVTAGEHDQQDGVRYPAGYPGVLSVTAVTDTGAETDAAIHGVHVGIAAPGQNVPVPWFNDGDCVISPEHPSTSLSTAYVGGVAALVAAVHPDESPEVWKWRLEVTALRADATKRSETLGWGILAPYEALEVTPSGELLGPLLPGATAPPAPAVVGRTPPLAEEDPLVIRGVVASFVTGGGVFVVATLWLVARARYLRRGTRTAWDGLGAKDECG